MLEQGETSRKFIDKILRNTFIPTFQSQMLAAFIILIFLDGLYITDQLIAVFVPIRYGIVGFLFIGFGIILLSKLKPDAMKKNEFHVALFHFILLSYGLFLSSVNGGFVLFESRDLIFTFFSIFLTLAVIFEYNRNLIILNSSVGNASLKHHHLRKINLASLLTVLLIISPVLLYIFDAIELRPIPRIIFDRSTNEIVYSQATSRFFGLGSILLLFFAVRNKSLSLSIFYLSFSIGLLALSGLGGARGEFLICILVLVFMLLGLTTKKRNWFVIVAFFAVSIWFFLPFVGSLDDLIIVKRISVFSSGDFGSRGQLLVQSFQLLVDRADCVLIGCGFNYFQVYFGNEYGLYPHNIFAELLITFGVPLGGSLVILACIGVAFAFLTSFKRTPLFWVFLYLLIISLKSGSLLGLTSIPVLLYFVYIGIFAIRQFYRFIKLFGASQVA